MLHWRQTDNEPLLRRYESKAPHVEQLIYRVCTYIARPGSHYTLALGAMKELHLFYPLGHLRSMMLVLLSLNHYRVACHASTPTLAVVTNLRSVTNYQPIT